MAYAIMVTPDRPSSRRRLSFNQQSLTLASLVYEVSDVQQFGEVIQEELLCFSQAGGSEHGLR
jgi:hypothetical protein